MAQTGLSMVIAHRESTNDTCVALIKMYNTSDELSMCAVHSMVFVAVEVSPPTGLLAELCTIHARLCAARDSDAYQHHTATV